MCTVPRHRDIFEKWFMFFMWGKYRYVWEKKNVSIYVIWTVLDDIEWIKDIKVCGYKLDNKMFNRLFSVCYNMSVLIV